MPVYKVQAPDGTIIKIEGPAGASQEEVVRQAQSMYAQRQNPVRASLSPTELAPGAPIPGMPAAPKLNMQYQGPAAITDTLAKNIYERKDPGIENSIRQMEDNYRNTLGYGFGGQEWEQGANKIKSAKSGSDVASGVSDMVIGGAKAYTPMAIANLGGAAVATGRQGLWPLLKLMGQVTAGGTAAAIAGDKTENFLKDQGVPEGYAQLGGTAASFAAPAALFKGYDLLASLLPNKGPMIPNTNTPDRQTQMDMLKSMGVELDKGQANNSDFARKLAQSGQNRFGTSTMTEQFYKNQARQLADASQKIVDMPVPGRAPLSGEAKGRYGTGEDVADRLQGVVAKLKSQADAAYSTIRGQASNMARDFQVGEVTRPPSLILGPNGAPAIPETTVPVMKRIEAPLDLRPFRTNLQGVYDELNAALPIVQKERSPSFAALKSVMESPDDAMPAVQFDRFLSALKSITRNGDNPFLTDTAQGLAKRMIASGETQLRDALGPELMGKLSEGRAATRGYHDVADFLASLNPSEPSKSVSKLLSNSDNSANALKTLRKYSPETIDQLGKMYLQEMFDMGTQEGGFGRTPGMLQRWNNLGKETKGILFGDKAKDVERFLLASKDIEKMWNPSGTGGINAIQNSLYRLAPAVATAMSGNPVWLASEGAYIAGNRKLGQMLLDQNPNSLDSLIEMSKIMSRPMGIGDYYRKGAPALAIGTKEVRREGR